MSRLLILFLIGSGYLSAQTTDLVDKTNGELYQIKERVRWFVEQRDLHGVNRPDLKRKAAVLQAREMARFEESRDLRPAWTALGPSPMTMLGWAMGTVAGRVTSIAVHPTDSDTIYLGTAAGGLWKTTNGGGSWMELFGQVGTQSIGALMIDPNQPETVWIGTGDLSSGCSGYFGLGLFKTSDGGASFTEMKGSPGREIELSHIGAMAFHPSNDQIIMVGGYRYCSNGSTLEGGLYRTIDGGQNWDELISGDINDIVSDPSDPLVFYTGVGSQALAVNGVYKSVDAGATWNRLENGLPSGTAISRMRLSMAPSQSNTLYALINQGTSNLYRSDDGGDSWTQTNTSNACSGQCSYNLCLDVSPTDPDTILVGTILHTKSTNSGATLIPQTSGWGSSQAVHQDTHVVVFDKQDGDRYWVGSDGGIWRTDNGGATFTNLNANLNITQLYDIGVDPNNASKVFGGAQDNSSLRTKGDLVWDVTRVTGDGFMNMVDPVDTDVIIQTGYPSGGFPSLKRSTTGGEPGTFNSLPTTGLISGGFPWKTPIALTANSAFDQTYYFVGSHRVFMSSNQGNNWVSLSATTFGGEVSVITPFANGSKITVFAGANGQIHRLDDALDANPVWENVTGNYPGGTVSDIAVDAADPTRIFVTRGRFGQSRLYRSLTGGTTWEAVGTGIPDVPANAVSIDPLHPMRIFVGSDVGIFESIDNGDNFVTMMVGFPLGTPVTDLEIDDNPYYLSAATYGRGAWQAPLIDDVVVEAGPNRGTCEGELAGLAAVVSNGYAPYAYTWSVLSGPDTSSAQFSTPSSGTPGFSPRVLGVYELQVQLTDALNVTVTDLVQVTASTMEAFTLAQRGNWASNAASVGWQERLDRNGDGQIDVLDLLIQMASPICW